MSVAVVIPAHNAGEMITACLASVAGQTVAPAEVVVVDDGSTDDTSERARQWAGRLNLTVVRQSNAGPAAARRRGIEVSEGRMIALLDADDVWLPDHLELLTGVRRQHGGLVTANALRWRPASAASMIAHGRRFPMPAPGIQRREILRRNFVFVSSLFSRDDYEAVAGFRDGWSGAEDWDLWIQLIRFGVTVRRVERPTCLYRLVESSLTGSANIYDRYIAMLSSTRNEVDTEEEREILSRSIGRYQARLQLKQGADAARAGQYRMARTRALAAIGGNPAISVQAVGMALAPRRSLGLQRALKRRRWG